MAGGRRFAAASDHPVPQADFPRAEESLAASCRPTEAGPAPVTSDAARFSSACKVALRAGVLGGPEEGALAAIATVRHVDRSGEREL